MSISPQLVLNKLLPHGHFAVSPGWVSSANLHRWLR